MFSGIIHIAQAGADAKMLVVSLLLWDVDSIFKKNTYMFFNFRKKGREGERLKHL